MPTEYYELLTFPVITNSESIQLKAKAFFLHFYQSQVYFDEKQPDIHHQLHWAFKTS